MKTTIKTRTSKAAFFTIGFLLLLTASLTFAQNVIRVQNGANIQNVIDNATTAAGSVLLLDPGSYEGFEVRKRVSIIGNGYFNGTNASVITGGVTFTSNNQTSSEGSLLLGCTVQSVDVRTDNIVLQRCRVQATGNMFYSNSIYIRSVKNLKINQCYVGGGMTILDNTTNFLVSNNIILGSIYFGNSTFSNSLNGKIIYNTIFGGGNCNPLSYDNVVHEAIVSNNIFISPINCDNRNANTNFRTNILAKFNNNIVRQGNYQSNDLSNKFLTDTDMARVLFAAVGTTADGQYLLLANSPAKGAGEGGTDCGAFGGPDPYVLTGSPIGPIIQDIQVPSTARQNETIQVKLKARVQN